MLILEQEIAKNSETAIQAISSAKSQMTLADIVGITFLLCGLVFWLIISIGLSAKYKKENQVRAKGYIVGSVIGVNVLFVILLLVWSFVRLNLFGASGFGVFNISRNGIFVYYLLVILFDLSIVISWMIVPDRLDPNSWDFLWKMERKMLAASANRKAKTPPTPRPSRPEKIKKVKPAKPAKVKPVKIKEKKVKKVEPKNQAFASEYGSSYNNNTYSDMHKNYTNNTHSNDYQKMQQEREREQALKNKKMAEQAMKERELERKRLEKERVQREKEEQRRRETILKQKQEMLKEQKRREEERRRQEYLRQQEARKRAEQRSKASIPKAGVNKVKNDFLYRCLGLNPNASEEAIKKAYRILAKKYHPDLSTDPSAPEKFMKVQKAYDVLSDKAKKLLYDREGVYKQ